MFKILRGVIIALAITLSFSMFFSDPAWSHDDSSIGEQVGVSVGAPANPDEDNYLPRESVIDTVKEYINHIKGCTPNPTLMKDISNIIIDLQNKGWHPKVVEICRTREQQAEKVRKGYSQTMHSKHLLGRAVDIVDSRYWWDIPDWHKFWKDYGDSCKKYGLIWGGDWKGFPDVAHCEMPEDMK